MSSFITHMNIKGLKSNLLKMRVVFINRMEIKDFKPNLLK